MSKSALVQAVDAWFATRAWKVFPFQRAVWKAAVAGESGLLHANTGAGKTYAVWFAALLRGALVEQKKSTGLRVLWITPMRALAADTRRALEESSQALCALTRRPVCTRGTLSLRVGKFRRHFSTTRDDPAGVAGKLVAALENSPCAGGFLRADAVASQSRGRSEPVRWRCPATQIIRCGAVPH